MTGLEWTKYARMGWERGPLGFPVADCAGTDVDGCQYFTGGAIDRYPTANGTLSVEMHGAIYTRIRAGLVELRPVSDELTTADGVGRFSHFVSRTTGRTASIYWSPANGAHVIWDVFMAKWAATGYESGIGYPTTDDQPLTPPNLTYQHFERGSIYWSPATGAHAVTNQTKEYWASTGW